MASLTYEQLTRRWADKGDKKLAPEEWEELRELLQTDMRARDIASKMSRGRGSDFIFACMNDLGVKLNQRRGEIQGRQKHAQFEAIYQENKAEIDKKLSEVYAVQSLVKEYSISRRFVEHLIVRNGYDLNTYMRRARINANQKAGRARAKQYQQAKAALGVEPYSRERLLALASPWVSTETPRYYWRSAA